MASSEFGETTFTHSSPQGANPFPLVGVRWQGMSIAEAESFLQRSQERFEQHVKDELQSYLKEWCQCARQFLEMKKMDPADVCLLAEEWARNCEISVPLEEARQVALELANGWPGWPPPAPNGSERGWTPDDLRGTALEKLGFTSSCWMPLDMAEQWQSRHYPTEYSGDALCQWREWGEQERAVHIVARREDLARQCREKEEADQRLLDAYAPAESETFQNPCSRDRTLVAEDQAGKRKKPKRSTEKGDAEIKIIAALTKHHQYENGGCLNLEPIGNNELARNADVDKSTASAFFKAKFDGHAKYKALCRRDASRLATHLKQLNEEFSPHILYGDRPPREGEPDEE